MPSQTSSTGPCDPACLTCPGRATPSLSTEAPKLCGSQDHTCRDSVPPFWPWTQGAPFQSEHAEPALPAPPTPTQQKGQCRCQGSGLLCHLQRGLGRAHLPVPHREGPRTLCSHRVAQAGAALMPHVARAHAQPHTSGPKETGRKCLVHSLALLSPAQSSANREHTGLMLLRQRKGPWWALPPRSPHLTRGSTSLSLSLLQGQMSSQKVGQMFVKTL